MKKKKVISKKKKNQKPIRKNIEIVITACLLAVVLLGLRMKLTDTFLMKEVADPPGKPKITEDFLTVNPYSRPQIRLRKVKGIVVHYVANPGSTAQQNRDYFEGLRNSHVTKASSHYIIGIEGEIVQCIPLNEISYASNRRNKDTISIECCHKRKDGKFEKDTYQSLIELLTWLCKKYNLHEKDIIRHYDVTGKLCPKYYVNHEDAWDEIRNDVMNNLKK